MLKGKCPRCGAQYYGWALRLSQNQVCDGCGVALEIIQDARKAAKSRPPVEVDKHTADSAPEAPSLLEKEYCLEKG